MKKIFRIYLYLTDKCNANCSFCYQRHSPIISENKNYKIEDIMKKINEEYEIEQLCIFGGEPTLELEKIKKILYLSNAKLNIIGTNGILLTNGIINELLNINDKLIIQINIYDIYKIPIFNIKNNHKIITYHLTFSHNELNNVIILSMLDEIKKHKVWISLDRYSEYDTALRELKALKEKDIFLYKEVLNLFTKENTVGRFCHGPYKDSKLINCINGEEFPCAGLMYKNIKNAIISKECINCNNEYCNRCICEGIQTKESAKILCDFYKYIKKEKEKKDVKI